MFKLLLKKQLLEITSIIYINRKNGTRNTGKCIAFYMLLALYCIGVFGGIYYYAGVVLCKPLFDLDLGWLYFSIFGIIGTLFGVFGSVFTAYGSLYKAKDNDLLLSMPIKPAPILLSRMIGIYLFSFLFVALAFIPSVIAYFTTYGFVLTTLISGIFTTIILPFISVIISCILGYLVAILFSFIKSQSIVKSLLTIGFVALFIGGIFRGHNYLDNLQQNGADLAENIKIALYPLYQMGLGLCGDFIALLIFTSIVLLLFCLVYFILSLNFLRLSTTNRGTKKTAYKEKRVKPTSPSMALLRKEFMHFTKSSIYFLNCGLGTVFMLVISGVAIAYRDLLSVVSEAFVGMEGFVTLIICIAIALISSMNDITAPSISLEGKNIWIAKSSPVSTWQVLKAKLLLHLIMTEISTAILAFVVSILLLKNLLLSIIMVLFSAVFVVLCASLGLAVNLKMPNLQWTSEAVAIKQNLGVMISLFGSWGIVVLIGALNFLTRDFLGPVAFTAVITVFVGIVAFLILRWIKVRGTVIFESL